MSAKLKIKKGDRVVVITGRDKGKQGEVIKVLPLESRVIVAGVNVAKRHTRPSAANPIRAAGSWTRSCRSTSPTSPI
jgi:large subunit ribosomal protein L24